MPIDTYFVTVSLYEYNVRENKIGKDRSKAECRSWLIFSIHSWVSEAAGQDGVLT